MFAVDDPVVNVSATADGACEALPGSVAATAVEPAYNSSGDGDFVAELVPGTWSDVQVTYYVAVGVVSYMDNKRRARVLNI